MDFKKDKRYKYFEAKEGGLCVRISKKKSEYISYIKITILYGQIVRSYNRHWSHSSLMSAGEQRRALCDEVTIALGMFMREFSTGWEGSYKLPMTASNAVPPDMDALAPKEKCPDELFEVLKKVVTQEHTI